MKLTYFHGDVSNFGDALNPYIWNRVLPPGFLDEDASELFVGIGSIIWDIYPRSSRKFVVGSGYGGYSPAPDVHDGTWQIVFVRGPRTARKLNIPLDRAICDGAILLRTIKLPDAAEGVGVAFMPHYDSMSRGNWAAACRLAGIHLIDPRAPVEQVMAEIMGAQVLITEAMHGAIVADALRTPWIAVTPLHPQHRGKWLDWADALGLTLRQHSIFPSGVIEAYVSLTRGRRSYGERAHKVAQNRIFTPANRVLTDLAAQRLSTVARAEPQLSDEATTAQLTERALEATYSFIQSRV
jgi:succinoglycan biosynthesis protein ExoV